MNCDRTGLKRKSNVNVHIIKTNKKQKRRFISCIAALTHLRLSYVAFTLSNFGHPCDKFI